MIKQELNDRSPLRILERSTQGGLGRGNMGVIAARQGVGKTACLVHIATDQLLQGKQVIHVSFATNPRHIVDWYEDIFREIAAKFGLESVMAVHDEMIRRRIIMNFNQSSIHLPQVIGSLQSIIRDGHFAADTIVVDAYDFSAVSREELEAVKGFAAEPRCGTDGTSPWQPALVLRWSWRSRGPMRCRHPDPRARSPTSAERSSRTATAPG